MNTSKYGTFVIRLSDTVSRSQAVRPEKQKREELMLSQLKKNPGNVEPSDLVRPIATASSSIEARGVYGIDEKKRRLPGTGLERSRVKPPLLFAVHS